MLIDPISDVFTRIRNAIERFHDSVEVPNSKLKLEIVKILKREGYIIGYENIKSKNQKILRIYLKYNDKKKKSAIYGLKRISKPGLRVYKGYKFIPDIIAGLGITIVSTSKGLMTNKEAQKAKLGGEILGSVW
ncbi:MAG: 30S ribosomal protein S8 [Endomicrobium sp.]|jgi:small subunit ribosomal protein S8|nr:30S ribosomal protein S8 [Endomicrobium sp.]